MNNVVSGGAAIQVLSLNELDQVGGGVDWTVVAGGLSLMAGGVLASPFPPAAAGLLTVGLHTVIVGLALDD